MTKKQFTRTGAYGLIIQDQKILLVRQTAGPYLNLWHLPGGGVEYGETPLQTLHRELLEEVAIQPHQPTFLTILSDHGEVVYPESYRYHHIGIVYRISELIPTSQSPEDESKWFSLTTLDLTQITPFVRQLKEQNFF